MISAELRNELVPTGTPRPREAAAAYLRAFAEDIKTGLVAQLIEKHGMRGLTVAPPAA